MKIREFRKLINNLPKDFKVRFRFFVPNPDRTLSAAEKKYEILSLYSLEFVCENYAVWFYLSEVCELDEEQVYDADAGELDMVLESYSQNYEVCFDDDDREYPELRLFSTDVELHKRRVVITLAAPH